MTILQSGCRCGTVVTRSTAGRSSASPAIARTASSPERAPYQHSAGFRQRFNKCLIHEPTTT